MQRKSVPSVFRAAEALARRVRGAEIRIEYNPLWRRGKKLARVRCAHRLCRYVEGGAAVVRVNAILTGIIVGHVPAVRVIGTVKPSIDAGAAATVTPASM